MQFQKKLNVGLRALSNTISVNHTNIISFDLTGHTDIQDSISTSKGFNQFNLTKNGLTLQITCWSCKSSTESSIKQVLVHSLNGLSIAKENQSDYSMLMLSFNQAVSLISLELGWIEGDNNLSLLALNESETNYFSDMQWSQLLANGWNSAGEYFNLDYKGNSNRVNLSGTVSKHWLIGAYNPNLYNFFSNNANQNCIFDRCKLQGVTVSIENMMIRAKKFAENRLFGRSNDGQ